MRRYMARTLFAALCVAIGAVAACRLACPAVRAPPDVAAWDVPRLARELNARGVPVRVNADAVQEGAGPRQLPGSAVLIDSSLSAAGMSPTSGSVYVTCDGLERRDQPPVPFRDAPEVGRLGPFHFRGDRAFADRIRAALH